MARQMVETVVSDLSGKQIPDGQAWTMTLTPPDGRRNPVRLDLSESEAKEFTARGTEVKRRGRRPGTVTARKTTTARKTAARKASANGRRKKTSATGRRKTR
jgi:hypothetical protein